MTQPESWKNRGILSGIVRNRIQEETKNLSVNLPNFKGSDQT